MQEQMQRLHAERAQRLDAMRERLNRLNAVQEQLHHLHAVRLQELDAAREQKGHLDAIQEMLQHLVTMRAQHVDAIKALPAGAVLVELLGVEAVHAQHSDGVEQQLLNAEAVHALPPGAVLAQPLLDVEAVLPGESQQVKDEPVVLPGESQQIDHGPVRDEFAILASHGDLIAEDSYEEDEEENTIVKKKLKVPQSNDVGSVNSLAGERGETFLPTFKDEKKDEMFPPLGTFLHFMNPHAFARDGSIIPRKQE